MKNLLTKSAILLLFTFYFPLSTVLAQVPQAINFQAIARDGGGNPMVNTNIQIRLSVLDSAQGGTIVYQELRALQTNDYGSFSFQIGVAANFVTIGTFQSINWASGNKHLKIDYDPTNTFTFSLTLGTIKFVSVPYAFAAQEVVYIDATGAQNGDALVFNSGTGKFEPGTVTAGTIDWSDVQNKPTIDTSFTNELQTLSISNDTLYLTNGGFVVLPQSGNTPFILPTITTSAVTNISSNGATFEGNISNANGNQIIERGFVFSITPNPTILTSNKVSVGSGIGFFDTTSYFNQQNITILQSNKTYYLRTYAITENNIATYGNEVTFTTLPTGQTGPGGGLVFFDKGFVSSGWRYLEAAPSDQSTGIIWGCYGNAITGTLQDVGAGEANTTLIVSGCADTSFAAKLCYNLTLGGQNDWFLPSKGELNLMYVNLHTQSLGGFASYYYWSSSEFAGNETHRAWYQGFANGSQYDYGKSSTYYVRAVRAF